MDCQETRQKLSTYADKELGRDELQALARHLAECPACSLEYKKQGALDMLLKSHFSHEPPQEYLDSFWPSVAERLEGEEGGAGSDDEVVVFKTSPALQSLNIPQRRQVTPAVTDEPAPEPPAESSPLRWPVALVVSTAIVVVGFLAYKKMFPRQQEVTAVQPPALQEPVEDRVGAMAPTEALDATQLALAPTGDGGLGMATADAEPSSATTDDNGERRTRDRARSRRARRRRKEAKSAAAPAAKSEPKAAPKPRRKPRPAPGKKTALDSLIDTAIGTTPSPKKKAAAAAPAAPASNLPEQLNMNQIRSAMNKIKPHVQACYDQYQVEGMAKVRFKISPDGKVLAPSIRGKFRGTDTGDCVIKAVKRASFPKFGGKPMTINSYPFLLQ
jgi:anti-sigma factor RsiW